MYRAFSIFGTPVFLHWTVPAMPIILAIAAPKTIVAAAAMYVLLFLHELGHLLAARAVGLPATAISLFCVYGVCIVEATDERRKEVLVYLGGILVQAAVLVLSLGAGLFWRDVLTDGRGSMPWYFEEIFYAFILGNLVLLILNSLPIYPLDGWYIWGRHRRATPEPKPPRTKQPRQDAGSKVVIFPSRKR